MYVSFASFDAKLFIYHGHRKKHIKECVARECVFKLAAKAAAYRDAQINDIRSNGMVIIYFLPSAAWRILIILLAFVVNERLEASMHHSSQRLRLMARQFMGGYLKNVTVVKCWM